MTRIWFHNGSGGNTKRRILSLIIKLWQGKYVHVEAQPIWDDDYSNIWYPIEYDIVTDKPDPYSISSRGAENDRKKNGVCWKYIDYTRHPERWTHIDVPGDIDKAVLNGLIGRDYDYLGAVGWRWKRQNSRREFCSEAICKMMHQPVMYPTALYRWLKGYGRRKS